MDEIKLHQFAERLELLGYSQRCVADYTYVVRRFLRYLEEHEGVRLVEDIRAEHITAYHTYLQFGHFRNGKHLAARSVAFFLGPLRTFFRIMAEEGLIPQDLSAHVVRPKRRTYLPRHVPSQQQMMQLLGAAGATDTLGIRNRCILELLYATGIRSQELRLLALDDYDSSEHTLYVTGKGHKDRVVPVGWWVVSYLREYLQVARPRLLTREDTDVLFLTRRGGPLSKGDVGYIVHKYVQRAGLERISPHTLRHACATHLLQNGADVRYVQELLGHEYLSSTQIYTRVDITDLKSVHKRFHPRERGENAG